MALSSINTNNKLVQYRKEIIREAVKENMFSPYMGDGMTSIIRTIYDAKKGGEQINIPLVTRLRNPSTGASGTLTGAEEAVNNYGMRVWVDWARHSVATNDAEEQKDSADIFGEAKPLLSDWLKELQRDEIIDAMAALPSESAPAGLGDPNGQRVNGILAVDASQANMDAWVEANSDRILFGALKSNMESDYDWSDSIVKLAAGGTDRFLKANLTLMKRIANTADPNIRPYKTRDGYEYYVAFCGEYAFRDLKADLNTDNQQAQARSGSNPIFQDGDLMYDGVIVRKVPQIDYFVDNVWKSGTADAFNLKTGGATNARVSPVFMCGQSAVALPWAKMPTPTQRSDTDYDFIRGVGIKACYGVSKIFKKHTSSNYLKQFGMVTGFFASAADS